ncbi:LysM peptidoglycan-binding domain-containing protein [Carnimonas bestiolae]|uniref:LysM peptidoglycan-binding domain-containing protein n=1 Tax=Carnimonas bestiolae TaxID=3402172 RepID=UPI003EDC2B33
MNYAPPRHRTALPGNALTSILKRFSRPSAGAVALAAMLTLGACATSGGGEGAGGWYSVERGDTMGTIARRNNIPALRLMRMNPSVHPDRLEVGQRIRLPDSEERTPGSGAYRYRVRQGDTLAALGQQFSSSASAIQSANSGLSANNLSVGRLIWIPQHGVRSGAGASASRQRQIAASRAAPAAPIPAAVKNWQWPLTNAKVMREFGANGSGTLEPMLLSATSDHAVKAAETGTVKFAENMRQLGNVVILHHANNMQSVYAQCDTLQVSVGQKVSQGSPVCSVGSSGSYAGQLLFDVRHAGKPVDPRRVLKK